MAIYGRFGVELIIKRRAVLADVKALDHRKADKQDREALALGSYWVVDFKEATGSDSHDRLYHLGFMRADDGLNEIERAIIALGDRLGPPTTVEA